MGRKAKAATPVETGGETPEVEIRATEQAPAGSKSPADKVAGMRRADMPAELARAKAAGDKPLVEAILKACSK